MCNAAVGYMNESAADGPGGGATIDRRPAGVVMVSHRTPMCTCSWTGRRRAAVALARHDAWMHAATTGCVPAVPFVAP
jgi:hypothetical protein